MCVAVFVGYAASERRGGLYAGNLMEAMGVNVSNLSVRLLADFELR